MVQKSASASANRMADTVAGLTSTDPKSVRLRIEAMEKLLEGLFVIPGTNFRVGLDALVDLIPGVGSFVTNAMSAWLVWEARNLGMPKTAMVRMAGNVGVDALLGLLSFIPVVGAIPDILFRSNTRNLKIIKRHLDKHHPGTAVIDQ
jgi:Domain of unknown function (DUF4112)